MLDPNELNGYWDINDDFGPESVACLLTVLNNQTLDCPHCKRKDQPAFLRHVSFDAGINQAQWSFVDSCIACVEDEIPRFADRLKALKTFIGHPIKGKGKSDANPNGFIVAAHTG